jgi:hypothetical protein
MIAANTPASGVEMSKTYNWPPMLSEPLSNPPKWSGVTLWYTPPALRCIFSIQSSSRRTTSSPP